MNEHWVGEYERMKARNMLELTSSIDLEHIRDVVTKTYETRDSNPIIWDNYLSACMKAVEEIDNILSYSKR
jgi:hypothetical protein